MMKHSIAVSWIWLVALTAGGQVASHAPTPLNAAPAGGMASLNPGPQAKPVAMVNGAVLTSADLVREEYAIFPYARQHNGIPKDLAAQIHDGAMKMMVFEELVYQEALKRHMTIAPLRLQRAEADFRKQFPAPDDFRAFLQNDFHGSEPLLQEKIRRSLLIDAFLKAQVENRSIVTPAEARAFYEKNPAKFQHPETYTFQTISILPPANATAAQLKEGRRRADQALAQAKQTKTAEEFGMLAEKTSDDDYRVVMGQHRPVPAEQLAPQVLAALRSMKPGQITGVIPMEQAYTIVRLGAHTPAGKSKFAEIEAPLQKQMHEMKRNELRAALDRQLRQNAKVEEFQQRTQE